MKMLGLGNGRAHTLSVIMFLLSISDDYIDMKVDLVVFGVYVERLAGCILQ